ncbi:MAG: hypothetical protein JW966_00130 [Anaerolineae bacterium]|nr:hypothetical protein [Anaerolineae bacterium]
MNTSPITFNRYVGLYTLHYVEDYVEAPADLFLLRVRIHTLRYSFLPLITAPADVNAAYRDDPRAGVERVRESVLPRLYTLLDVRDPFAELNLLPDQNAVWQRYAAERSLPAETGPHTRVGVPRIVTPVPHRRLPTRSTTSERLARIQQTLHLLHTAAETASTLAAAWQNWQIGQGRRKLLDAQRILLQDTIQAQLAGQNHALDHALQQDYVRGYLADHAGDTVYDIVLGGDDSPDEPPLSE